MEGAGKFADSEEHYKKALELHPNWPEVQARYDKLRYRLNDPAETLKKAAAVKADEPRGGRGTLQEGA